MTDVTKNSGKHALSCCNSKMGLINKAKCVSNQAVKNIQTREKINQKINNTPFGNKNVSYDMFVFKTA